MNWATLQEEAASLAFVPDMPPPARQPNWGTLTNSGLKQLSWDTEYNIEEVTVVTVLNQAEYTLAGSPWKYLTEALYDTTKWLEKISELRLRRYNALWRMEDAGEPSAYWMPTPNKFRVYPKPATASVNMYLRGVREAPALTNVTPGTTDVPPFPETYQWGIPHWAALLYLRTLYAKTRDEALMKAIGTQIGFCESEYERITREFKFWLATDDAVIVQRTNHNNPDRIRI